MRHAARAQPLLRTPLPLMGRGGEPLQMARLGMAYEHRHLPASLASTFPIQSDSQVEVLYRTTVKKSYSVAGTHLTRYSYSTSTRMALIPRMENVTEKRALPSQTSLGCRQTHLCCARRVSAVVSLSVERTTIRISLPGSPSLMLGRVAVQTSLRRLLGTRTHVGRRVVEL